MSPRIRACLLTLLILVWPDARAWEDVAAPAATTALTPTQASADLELAVSALEAALPDIYWHQSREEWRIAKAAARSRIDQITDSEGLWRILMPLLARIGEGHLSLERSEAMKQREREQALLLPLAVHWTERGAYVIAGYGEAGDIPRGSAILSIDGKDARTLADELMFAATHDGAIRTGILREASGNGYGELLYRMSGSRPRFRLILQARDGSTVMRDVAGVPAALRKGKQQPTAPAVATLEWLDERTAYLDVPTFSNKRYRAAGADFASNLQRLFDELDRRGASNLILDLRDNGGGSEPNESILFSYLVEQPLRKYAAVEARGRRIAVKDADGKPFTTEVFDDDEMKTQRSLPNGRLTRRNFPPEGLMTRWSRSAPIYRGRLVVLAGGDTFSGGAELASMLFHVRRAVFVGEEVGGTHEGNTSGYRWPLTLPNSGMTLRIPLLQFRFAWPGLPRDRGVRPDCMVPPDVMELGQRRDAAWRSARDILRQPWATPAAATCPVETIEASNGS